MIVKEQRASAPVKIMPPLRAEIAKKNAVYPLFKNKELRHIKVL